jgi:cytochrome c553
VGGKILKKLLLLAFGLVIASIFSACGSSNNDMTNSTRQAEQTAMDSSMTTSTRETAPSGTDSEQVELPENYDKGVLYTTVTRGNVKELLYTSREIIEAVKAGKPFPSGTVLTLEIYRDGKLSDIFVSEKRTGWGDQNSTKKSNGDWRYQAFIADKSVNTKRDIGSCISCHASEVRDDFVYTYNQMKSFKLEDFKSLQDTSTESRLAATPLADWEYNALKAYMATLSSDKTS